MLEGVSFYGLDNLILLKGTMQEFSYVIALEYYKDNYENFKNINKNIFFEQDGASSHTSKKTKKLLEELYSLPNWNTMGRIKKKN